jgi:Na+/proline symporter/nitrogen-specific signal transduction histidine kinase
VTGGNALVVLCLGYAAFLFAIAFWADRSARSGRGGWVRTPLVYTLSLSVYCTGWTFYGAVGSAARSGLEFVTIYLGPSLVFLCWWWLLRKLVRIGHAQRITSIADLLSSRYGKSPAIGVLATILAVVGATPYIALQLKSLTLSFSAFPGLAEGADALARQHVTAFWLAIGLAAFTILFGTRNIDANEQHHGVVTAIAVEAVVKLLALLAVGAFVVWQLYDGPADVLAAGSLPALDDPDIFGSRWVTLTFLSASAIICLPRMFQVMVVENSDERHLATAAWAFPLYLFLISLFVLPIALAGKALLPDANPDLYVLVLPLSQGAEALAMFAFIGGFSASTSMVIVAAIALSTMISNHIAVPVWLRLTARKVQTSGDIRDAVLVARRAAIGVVLALGYVYFRLTSQSAGLAAIGLIAFAGLAQLLPSVMAGLFWRGATARGALAGIAAGFATWAYTLFLPSFEGNFLLTPAILSDGAFGLAALRPQALFGLSGWDPLVHSVFWSMLFNAGLLVAVSLSTRQSLMERVQTSQFVDVFRLADQGRGMMIRRSATAEDLYTLAQRILGTDAAYRLFAEVAQAQGKSGGLPDATEDLIASVERRLTGSIGAASAHAMIGQFTGTGAISVDELIRIADETAQIVEYSQRLERQSRELTKAAAQLREANRRLTSLSEQKDAFLSQVSHELRTPMTSVRSFAEILRDTPDLPVEDARRFIGIIHEESQRLTRILDEILDLSVLESGQVRLSLRPVRLDAVVAQAASSTEGLRATAGVSLTIDPQGMAVAVMADADRLAQVLINLISNAVKYGKAAEPEIRVRAGTSGGRVWLEVADKGPGIRAADRERAFEKFSRLNEVTLAGSAGLGLPISREIMRNLGGDLVIVPSEGGAVFRLTLDPAGGAGEIVTTQAAE